MHTIIRLIVLLFITAAVHALAQPASSPLPIGLVYPTDDSPRGLLPITTAVFIEGDRPDSERAGWILEYERTPARWEPWPSQLDGWTRTGGAGGPAPAWTARLSFFPPEGTRRRASFRLRQRTADEPPPNSRSPTPSLRLDRTPKRWAVESGKIQFHLDGDDKSGSGQLAAVTVTGATGPVKLVTERGPAVHRNPDIYIHGRPWAHAHKWNPPDTTTTREGPLVIEILRAGAFPGLPQARLRMRYRFFAGRNFMESASEVEMLEDVALISLRNDQLIFAPGTFTHLAWREMTGANTARFADHPAINDHGDILKLRPDTPWILFWHEQKGTAAGTVRVAEFNAGPGLSAPVDFDRTTLIMNRPELQSWVRPQVYQNVSWSRQAGIHLAKGSRFSETNLYFFTADAASSQTQMERLYQEIQHAPLIAVGNGPFAPTP